VHCDHLVGLALLARFAAPVTATFLSQSPPEVRMDLVVASIAERPDLTPMLDRFPDAWPEFMYHDPISSLYYDFVVSDYPEYCLVAVDPVTGEPVAKACTVPFSRPGGAGADLPPDGYDAAILSSARDRLAGRTGNLIAAIEVAVRPERRGAGVSATMVAAVRRNAQRLGHSDLLVPVRPNAKHEHPDVPMAEYVRWARPDGLPADPWLRVHARAGGRMVGIAARSMVITGTLAEWRTWTGLPFDAPGPVRVPGALVPVHCDVEAGVAVYVEPNVWVRHKL
jgi:GNAT superfamily N-acetyltransferase